MNRTTEDPPLISCVMPTYGRPGYLPESVAFFLSQDYPNKELLILNDCPGQEFRCDSPGVRVVNRDPRFPSLGVKRNEAVALARGDWIAVWDDDDVYLPWHLSYAMRRIAESKTLFHRADRFWTYNGQAFLERSRHSTGWGTHALTVFHRSLWARAGGYAAKNLGEDTAMFEQIHGLLNQAFLADPCEEHNWSFLVRAHSDYAHISIPGGRNPLDLAPRRMLIEPKVIQDPVLRAAYEQLIRGHERHRSLPTGASPANLTASTPGGSSPGQTAAADQCRECPRMRRLGEGWVCCEAARQRSLYFAEDACPLRKWGRAHHRARRPRLVIGLGTGRCGTMSLSQLLGVPHEPGLPLPWQEDRLAFEATSQALLGQHQTPRGAVAFYLLQYVRLLDRVADCRFICLRRDRQAVIDSYERKIGRKNHWTKGHGRLWEACAFWDGAFPSYDPMLPRAEAIGLYWDEYNRRAAVFAEDMPNFRLFATDDLNTTAGCEAILAFAGLERTPEVGICVNLTQS